MKSVSPLSEVYSQRKHYRRRVGSDLSGNFNF